MTCDTSGKRRWEKSDTRVAGVWGAGEISGTPVAGVWGTSITQVGEEWDMSRTRVITGGTCTRQVGGMGGTRVGR